MLFNRSRQNYMNNGLPHFFLRVFRALVLNIVNSIFVYRTWYIYEHDLHNMANKREEYFTPKVPNLTYKVIKNIDEAKEITKQGFHFFGRTHKETHRLFHGSIAFCVFYGTELVHIGWLCMTEEARNSIEAIPYRIDFSRMASIEGSETMPEFRAGRATKNLRSYKGLMAYTYLKRAQYLIERGIFIARYSILTDNIPSQKIIERFGVRKISIIRLIRILGFKFWKEIPGTEPSTLKASIAVNS